MHGVFVPQPAVIGIGIGDDIGGEHVILNRGDHNPSSILWGILPLAA